MSDVCGFDSSRRRRAGWRRGSGPGRSTSPSVISSADPPPQLGGLGIFQNRNLSPFKAPRVWGRVIEFALATGWNGNFAVHSVVRLWANRGGSCIVQFSSACRTGSVLSPVGTVFVCSLPAPPPLPPLQWYLLQKKLRPPRTLQ